MFKDNLVTQVILETIQVLVVILVNQVTQVILETIQVLVDIPEYLVTLVDQAIPV